MRTLLSVQLLRAHVNQCAAAASLRRRQAADRVAQASRNTKVGYLQLSAPVHHEVRWFQITMDNAGVIVRVIEGLTKLARPSRQLIWLENSLFLFGAQIGKRFPIYVFHGNAGYALVVLEMVNPNDVLMRQPKTAARLAFQAVQ